MKLVRPLVLLPVLFLCISAGIRFGPSGKEAARAAAVERGRYLVAAMVCADCHTPWIVGPNGPEPDPTRALSGHPADLAVTTAPSAPGAPWEMVATGSHTAWAGPWGVSFTANLTPDVETGLGGWTEDMFLSAIRTGRHLGRGRPILPPMPYFAFRNLNDYDLKAIFAYLRTIPAVSNRVPEPLPPTAAQ